MPLVSWSDLTTPELDALPKQETVAVLPVAAVEQHGPHLPLGTDTIIAEAMLRETAARLSKGPTVVALPVEALGASAEHSRSAGTLSLPPDMALARWLLVGDAVARLGIRRLIVVTSHGGNSEIIALLVRELRLRHAMLAIATSWARMGYPDGLFPPGEIAQGWHGGAVETSLMLAIRPDLVRLAEARDFVSVAAEMERHFTHLRPTGRVSFGWTAQDVNPAGVVGDASSATAEKGRAVMAFQADRFVEVIEDALRFDVARLG
jgi:creatinine amidohydrolase